MLINSIGRILKMLKKVKRIVCSCFIKLILKISLITGAIIPKRKTYIFLFLLSSSLLANGETYEWVTDNDADWESKENWSIATNYPHTANDSVFFGNCITSNRYISLTNSITIYNMCFDSPYSYTIDAEDNDLTFMQTDVLMTVSNGHHKIILNELRIPANNGCEITVMPNASMTIEGIFNSTFQSGRGISVINGGGCFRVTGQTTSGQWRNLTIKDTGTEVIFEDGFAYSCGYNASQNRSITVNAGTILRAGGVFEGDISNPNPSYMSWGSPNLNLKGTLDVLGELLWTGGHLNLAEAEAIEFTLGSKSDVFKYYCMSAGKYTSPESPTITGPSNRTIKLNIMENPGIKSGTYDLIDWSEGTNTIQLSDFELTDFELNLPSEISGVLHFDNNLNPKKLQITILASGTIIYLN